MSIDGACHTSPKMPDTEPTVSVVSRTVNDPAVWHQHVNTLSSDQHIMAVP